MQIWSIVFFFVLHNLGETYNNSDTSRAKRQLHGIQFGNSPRQTFSFTTPQTFVIGNGGFQQSNPNDQNHQGNQNQQGNHNHGHNIPRFCRGHKINRPECRQYAQGIGFPSGNQNSNNCSGNRRNNPGCQSQGQEQGQGGFVIGNQNPNCSGRRKRRPECQGQSGGLNCNGRRKNRPECQAQTVPGGNTGSSDTAIQEAFQQIPWLQSLTNKDKFVALPGLPKTPSNNAQSRFYQLAIGARDDPFQRCFTPRFENGHCRYLQHCILPVFVQNFNIFLRYVCFINGVYVGVCCPDHLRRGQPTPPTLPTTIATTTLRPPTPPTARGCGISSVQQTKIVGGRPSQLNKFPWAAALLRNKDNQYCGGVLITNRHVLTAAHCIDGFATDSIIVRLGEYSFDDQTESSHKDFNLQSIKKHERYDTATYENDLAILTLERNTDFNKAIWNICLPPANANFEGETATVIGWGTIYFGGPVSAVLQEVSIPVWNNAECDAAYKDNKVFPINLCAGDKDGGKDSCQGDSGGPLMLQWGPEKRWTIIGIVSWGIRCADPGIPGVYARVSELLGWINQNTR